MSSKGRERPVIYVVPCIAGNLRISGEASLLTYSFEGWIQGGAKGGTYHKHTGEEAAKVDIGRVEFWRKVVGRGAARAYPVGERREDECEGWFVWVQVSHSVRPCKMCVEQNVGVGHKVCRNVPTRRGSQFAQSAHDRMTSRKPAARMNERRMTAVFPVA